LNFRDAILGLAVVIVWGATFTVIKLALDGISPILLAALRFGLAAIPAVAFVSRPNIAPRYLITHGLTVGVGQFGCLFYAMTIGMPAGIASVVLQSQAFFTIVLAAIFLHESVSRSHLAGLGIASLGLGIIAFTHGSGNTPLIPFPAFMLTLVSAAFWGVSNIIIRKAVATEGKGLNMFSMVVWSSLIPPIPLFLLALLIDTPEVVKQSIFSLNYQAIIAVAFLAFAATLFGFGGWSRLLSRYPVGIVAPLSLLVPVAGLITSMLVLGEKLTVSQWFGCFVVISGLLVVSYGARIFSRIAYRIG